MKRTPKEQDLFEKTQMYIWRTKDLEQEQASIVDVVKRARSAKTRARLALAVLRSALSLCPTRRERLEFLIWTAGLYPPCPKRGKLLRYLRLEVAKEKL